MSMQKIMLKRDQWLNDLFVRSAIFVVLLIIVQAIIAAPLLPSDVPTLNLVGRWPGYSTGGAIDIFATNKTAYIAASSGGLMIVDVSNPENPTRVGSCDTGGWALGVALSGNLVLVADQNSGLKVIDVSNPKTPTVIASCSTNIKQPNGVAISSDCNYAYVASRYGLQAVDIRDPLNPVVVGNYFTIGGAQSVSINDHFAFVAEQGGRLNVIDVANPTNLILIGNCAIGGSPQKMSISGNLIYLADAGSGLQIIDISSPSSPVLVGCDTSSPRAYAVRIKGNIAYLATETDGLKVLDVSNPTNLVVLGNSPSQDAFGVSVDSGYAYVADWENGLRVVDISNSDALKTVGTYQTYANAGRVAIRDKIAFLPYGFGLEAIDVSMPTNPVCVGHVSTKNRIGDISLNGNYAYVGGTSEIDVIDISIPTNPVVISSCTVTNGNAWAVNGDHVYVAEQAGLQIIDISNPSNPVAVGFYATKYPADKVGIHGNYAYIELEYEGVIVLDISDSKQPVFSRMLWNLGESLDISGNYAYIECLWGMEVFDLSDPFGTESWLDYWGAYISTIEFMDNYAIVSEGSDGIEVVNTMNPANLFHISSYNFGGWACTVTVAGDYAYVCAGEGGLQILSISPASNAPPQIVFNPQDFYLPGGTNVTFSVTAIGTAPLCLTWQQNGTNLVTGNRIGCVTNAELTIANIQASDMGSYSVVVSNAWGTAVSYSAALGLVHSPTPELVPGTASITDNAQFQFSLAGAKGSNYEIQVSHDLTNWMTLQVVQIGYGPMVILDDCSDDMGFYRAILLP